jgi:hypothetical protein
MGWKWDCRLLDQDRTRYEPNKFGYMGLALIKNVKASKKILEEMKVLYPVDIRNVKLLSGQKFASVLNYHLGCTVMLRSSLTDCIIVPLLDIKIYGLLEISI